MKGSATPSRLFNDHWEKRIYFFGLNGNRMGAQKPNKYATEQPSLTALGLGVLTRPCKPIVVSLHPPSQQGPIVLGEARAPSHLQLGPAYYNDSKLLATCGK